MTTRKTTELRRCTGSARFGIEPHEAPTAEFPKQPSRKDGLGTMCTEHWRAYVKGLREARRTAAADGPEADAAKRGTRDALQRALSERLAIPYRVESKTLVVSIAAPTLALRRPRAST